jgi:hypothetical protein
MKFGIEPKLLFHTQQDIANTWGFGLLRLCPACLFASFVLRPSEKTKLALALRSQGLKPPFDFRLRF